MSSGDENEIFRAFINIQRDRAAREGLCDAVGTWSQEEIFHNAIRLSSALIRKGVQRGDPVVIVSERCATFVVCLLGVLMAGGRFLVVDRDQVNDHNLDVLERLSPAHWLSIDSPAPGCERLNSSLFARLEHRLTRVPLAKSDLALVLAAEDLRSDRTHEMLPVAVGGTAPAYLIWTSGTTAAPKLVSTLHRSVVNFLDWYIEQFHIDCADRFALLSGLAHDPVIRDIFTPLSVGASLQIPSEAQRNCGESSGRWLQEAKPTIVHLTPPMLELLGSARRAVEPVTSVRLVASGGARLTFRHVGIARTIFPKAEIANFYGTSETPQAMAFHLVDRGRVPYEADRHGVPIGKGIRGAELLVLTAGKNRCAPEEVGEIFVRSRFISEGYVGLPEPTRSQFIQNPLGKDPSDRVFATRDLGMYDHDGRVHWLGRVDRQVKIGANRVSPDDLEAELAELASVRQVAVAFDERTSRLFVYIAPKPDEVVSEAVVRCHLAGNGPFPIVPARIYFLDTLPLTTNGKTDYARLKALEPALDTPRSVLPDNAVQAEVRRVWTSELSCTTFDPSDTFLELGGNSFTAIRIAGLLSERLGTSIRVVDLFAHPTLDSLSRFLSEREFDAGAREQLELRMIQRRKMIARANRKEGA